FDAKADADMAFVLELARTLQRHGVPTRPLEQTVSRAAARLGLRVEVFATLTAMILSFGAAERTMFLRFEPTEIDLGALARLDSILYRFLNGACGVDEVRAEFQHLGSAAAAARVRAWQRLGVAACGAASWVVLLRGGRRELLAAAVAGLLLE